MLIETILWLALNTHHEARGEPYACQVMTAEVVLRRVDSEYYPDTVEEVVLEDSQFSWTSDTELRDFSYVTYKDMVVALEALQGSFYTTNELHYAHVDVDNYWTSTMRKSMQCGAHVFYDNGGLP